MKEFYLFLLDLNKSYPLYYGLMELILFVGGACYGWQLREAVPYIKAYFKERKLKKKEVKG